jgi:ABC-type lipoprotein release transport system permease subunit
LKCIEGSYFSGTLSNQILVSETLAKKLNVSIRKKVVMTFQNSKSEISGGAFRIAGIFKT